MRIISESERRHPNEGLFFEGPFGASELVIDQSLLPEVAPRIHVLNGLYVAAVYQDRQGESRTRDMNGHNRWQPGEGLVGLEAGEHADIDLVFGVTGRSSEIVGDLTDAYQVAPDDTLLLEHRTAYEPVEHAASEPLPGNSDTDHYELEGIVRGANGEFVSARPRGGGASYIELAVAARCARTALDVANLSHAVGGGSLRGMLRASRPGAQYLRVFRDRTGLDFMPSHEPIEMFEACEPMTQAERAFWHKAIAGLATSTD
jgi:hypothetical protein